MAALVDASAHALGLSTRTGINRRTATYALHRLEEQGYTRSRWQVVAPNAVLVYSATAKGRRAIATAEKGDG